MYKKTFKEFFPGNNNLKQLQEQSSVETLTKNNDGIKDDQRTIEMGRGRPESCSVGSEKEI